MFQDLPPPPPVEAPAEAEDLEIILWHERIPESIVITAARNGEPIEDSSKSITVISPGDVERLGEDHAAGLLRLLPSVAIAQTGPRGTQSQLRIRGAEANHTLLFIDGIKANDPAAGNEARFELAANGLYDFIEIARGPQSAIWGSEALGGVIAFRSDRVGSYPDVALRGEAGSFGSLSGNARLSVGDRNTGMMLLLGGQRATGIDSYGSDGEKDGYRNINTRLKGQVELGDDFYMNLSAFAIDGKSDFDGFDPTTFMRADTDDATDNRLGAARLGVEFWPTGGLNIEVGTSLLASENINSNDGDEINRTSAERHTIDAQAHYYFDGFNFSHRLTIAATYEGEDFRAEDIGFGGFTEQDQERSNSGYVAEWFSDHSDGFTLQLALRHDVFSDFNNATSFSAGGVARITDNVSLVANYGEGISQPSFYDLYGFFPGSFVGNPVLKPESSQGFDVGLRIDLGAVNFSAMWFDQDLRNEIVDIFDPSTFTSTTANGQGKSKRSGLEIEANWDVASAVQLKANYSYLDATGPQTAPGTRLRETRRPRHRAAIYATGSSGEFNYGASLSIVGARFDDDFDLFPAERVKLDAYAIASARISYHLNDNLEVSLRGTNLFNSDYQDVVGYDTQGRAVFLGISFAR